jgi:hypothetical protein
MPQFYFIPQQTDFLCALFKNCFCFSFLFPRWTPDHDKQLLVGYYWNGENYLGICDDQRLFHDLRGSEDVAVSVKGRGRPKKPITGSSSLPGKKELTARYRAILDVFQTRGEIWPQLQELLPSKRIVRKWSQAEHKRLLAHMNWYFLFAARVSDFICYHF